MKTRHKAAIAYFTILSVICILAFTRTFPIYVSNFIPSIACFFEYTKSSYRSFIEYLSHSYVLQELYLLFPKHMFFSFFPVHEHYVNSFNYNVCVTTYYNHREPAIWDPYLSDNYLLAILLPFWAPLLVPLFSALFAIFEKRSPASSKKTD